MLLPTLLTAVVLNLSLACSLAWGKPPVKPQKGNTAQINSSQQQNDETISEFLQPPLWGAGKMRAFKQGQDFYQQSPEKQMEIMKGNQAAQLTTPLPRYKCRFCPKTYITRGRLTTHENNCKGKTAITLQNQSSPTGSPSSPGITDPDEELLRNEKSVPDEEPLLTLAECSRLVSAYMEHPEWQEFLDFGRHAITQTTAIQTGWNELKLDTVCPADKGAPFPALTPSALKTLMQLSPTINRLYQQLQTGSDPLADRDDLKTFIKKADQNSGELFAGGNHSLVIKWRRGPGYVLKIARSRQDHIRLTREQNLYLWLRHPDNVLINLTTTPMRAAFSIYGKPILALRQVDGTARDRLRLMREHSLSERLDFALSVIQHFCQMYRRFLEKDVLLADRHDDNIGFNEIPLQGRKSMGLDDAIIQVPVMLDLDPYWFGDQESRMMQLHLPTWVPVMTGLLEQVFTPVNSDSEISKSRVEVINQLRQLASPVFISLSSSAALPGTNSHERAISFPSPRGDGKDIAMVKKADRESALWSCTNHWFRDINPEYSGLLAEARSRIEPLLISLNQWDSTPRTAADWNKRLQENIAELLQWLNSWKSETRFSLLQDFSDEGIIGIPAVQGSTCPQDRQILALLSMIHGRLGCQNCSRTFTSNTDFRRHRQLHQQNKLKHCKVCAGDFTQITRHERIHTGEKPYKCKHCGKCFSLKGTLNTHLHTHSCDKPCKCEHCGKCFSLSSTLKDHLRTHSGDKPYKCEHCGRCFSLSSTLKGHLRTHSGDKPYRCEHCGKCFSQNGALQLHLRTHSGDKPYRCEHCGKCFSQSNGLKRHLRTHSGAKLYKCENCGRCFSRSSSLKNHLRTHSGYQP